MDATIEEVFVTKKKVVKKETIDQALARIESRYLKKATTPLKAVRAKCVQCTGGQVRSIATCVENTCALHPFRMGANPFHSQSKNKIPKKR